MRSITELSNYLECCPLILNKIFLKNEIFVRSEFGINDGFISADLADFIKEKFEYQLSSIISMDEILKEKSEYIPIKEGSYVYFLIQDNEIVYVGQSNQLLGRIQNHINTSGKVFNYISIFQVDVKKHSLNEIEQIHIHTINPILNKVKYSKLQLIENIVRRYKY